MLSPRWRKVFQDLWRNSTLLVVLSIAVGVFALGSIAGSRVILLRDMRADYSSISPQSAVIGADPFDDELLDSVRRMKQVREADGRATIMVQYEASPGVWKDMQLSALRDYNNIRINKIFPVSGAWPRPKKSCCWSGSPCRSWVPDWAMCCASGPRTARSTTCASAAPSTR